MYKYTHQTQTCIKSITNFALQEFCAGKGPCSASAKHLFQLSLICRTMLTCTCSKENESLCVICDLSAQRELKTFSHLALTIVIVNPLANITCIKENALLSHFHTFSKELKSCSASACTIDANEWKLDGAKSDE